MQIILSALGWLLNTAGFVQENPQLELQPVLELMFPLVYIKKPPYLVFDRVSMSSILYSSTYMRNISSWFRLIRRALLPSASFAHPLNSRCTLALRWQLLRHPDLYLFFTTVWKLSLTSCLNLERLCDPASIFPGASFQTGHKVLQELLRAKLGLEPNTVVESRPQDQIWVLVLFFL